MLCATKFRIFDWSLLLPVTLLMISACADGSVGTATQPEPTMKPSQVTESLPSPTVTLVTLVPTSSPTAKATHTPMVSPTVEVSSSLIEDFVTVEVGEYYVDPPVLTITVGTTIEWVPFGEREHTIVSMDGEAGWPKDGSVGGAGSPPFRSTFKIPGVYPYFCSIHPSVMDGKIVVFEETGSESP
jgi:plastocyanin